MTVLSSTNTRPFFFGYIKYLVFPNALIAANVVIIIEVEAL